MLPASTSSEQKMLGPSILNHDSSGLSFALEPSPNAPCRPFILMIPSKRIEGIFGRKIDKAIAFEEILFLSKFMCKGSQDFRQSLDITMHILRMAWGGGSVAMRSSLAKSMATEVKFDKASPSLQTKFNGLANSLFRKPSVTGNGKIDPYKIQPAVENGMIA